MEPIRGHESADDDRLNKKRPSIKAPIPFETGSAKKHTKEQSPVKHLEWEEGTLFQREPEEDKLRPDEPKKPSQEAVEPAADTLTAESFDEEVDRQLALEVAREEAAELATQKPDTPVEAAVVAAEQELITKIEAEVDAAAPAEAEAAIDKAYQEMIDTIQAESKPAPAAAQPVETKPVENDSLRAAREAAEAAYRESAPVAEIKIPDLEGAVPLAPTVPEAAQTPTPRAEYPTSSFLSGFLAGEWFGLRRKKQPEARSPKATIAHLRNVISHREQQIAELEREHYIDELAIETASKDSVAAQAQSYRAPGQEMLTMPLPVNQHAGRAEGSLTSALSPEQQSAPVTSETVPRPPAAHEQMSQAQLLQIAEQIYVDGVTVKSMFEVGRFDQESLRRIVEAHLRGEQVSQVVNQEVQRHDRQRYQRFETLNQAALAASAAAYGPPVPVLPQTGRPVAHGSLPAPQLPVQPNAGTAVNPNQPSDTTKPTASSSTIEKVVLGVSILMVIIASVILIGLFTRS